MFAPCDLLKIGRVITQPVYLFFKFLVALFKKDRLFSKFTQF